MQKILKGILLITILLLQGCIAKDYFGESTEANILTFEIEGQSSSKITPQVDWRDTGYVDVVVPSTMDMANLKVRLVSYSNLARPTIDASSVTNFSEPVVFKVIAENSAFQKVWKIVVKHPDQENAQQQIDFSDMSTWTVAKTPSGEEIKLRASAGGLLGYVPGDGVTQTSWCSTAEANANAMSQIDYFTTRPMPNNVTPSYARMETIEVDNGATQLAKAKVVTGALFTGRFYFDYNMGLNGQTRQMLDFGVPFNSRPKSVTFKMRYTPGETMKDGLLNIIREGDAQGRPTKDSCDIYFILQNRDQGIGNYVRIASAWLRTSEKIGDVNSDDGFVEQTLEFTYGKPNAAQLADKPYMNIGGSRGEVAFYAYASVNGTPTLVSKTDPIKETFVDSDKIDETPVTHIIVMFSSSAYGDNFWAAVNANQDPSPGLRGSTLDIKDVKFNYDAESGAE